MGTESPINATHFNMVGRDDIITLWVSKLFPHSRNVELPTGFVKKSVQVKKIENEEGLNHNNASL